MDVTVENGYQFTSSSVNNYLLFTDDIKLTDHSDTNCHKKIEHGNRDGLRIMRKD